MSLVELFSDVDDFCQYFEPRWEKFLLKNGLRQRRRSGNLSLSEIVTIMIRFHQSGNNYSGYIIRCDSGCTELPQPLKLLKTSPQIWLET